MSPKKIQGKRGEFDDDVLKAIGRIAVEFNLLELCISAAVNGAFFLEYKLEVAEIFLAELPTKSRVAILFSLLRESNNDERIIGEIDSLIKRYSEAEQIRNRYLHSRWSPAGEGEADTSKSSAKPKRGYQTANETLSAAEIHKAADKFHTLGEDIVNLFENEGLVLPVNELRISNRE